MSHAINIKHTYFLFKGKQPHRLQFKLTCNTYTRYFLIVQIHLHHEMISSRGAVSDVAGDLALDPLEAVPDRRLELSLHGQNVVGGHPPLPLELRIGAAAGAVEVVGAGPVLIVVERVVGR